MRLLVTRPAPDAGAQAERLRALGHEPIVSPLLKVEFLNPELPALSCVQALIVTSRNGLRALEVAGKLESARALPLFAVGSASAKRARELGFEEVYEGPGTAEGLAPLIVSKCVPARGLLLHLAGERIAFDLKGALEGQGFEAAQPALYRTLAASSFSTEAHEALVAGALEGVIVMSPATARAYMELVAAQGLGAAAAKPAYFCLSENVAAPLAALEGARIIVSPSPSEDDLLALARCKAAKC
ncbi:uroporphyrinogen-III synthase [bacterium BMS3Bbin10]|nr:uroporphyrinogen-III synthase [bacterium BMS3Bbin10]